MNTLGLFGLGYVGREVASLALKRGLNVHAVDIDESVIAAVESEPRFSNKPGEMQAATEASKAISAAQFLIIAVPTPLSSASVVELAPLRSVCQNIAKVLERRDQPLPIVVESTIPPGTVPEVVAPIFADHGFDVGKHIYLAHAPERIDPGNTDWPLESLPRVIGGMTETGTRVVGDFYDSLLDAGVYQVNSPQVAAAAKIIENAYRDINIAFVNEIALTLDHLDIDVTEALDAAETKPFGFTRFYPGVGVGGHCIPIDPYFLIKKGDSNGFNNRFLKTAREINNRMPVYLAERTIRALVQDGTLPQEATAVLLGKAFKPGVEDTRNSPYHTIHSKLDAYNMTIETYDPYLPEGSTVDSAYVDAEVLILITAHPEFRDLKFDRLAANGVELFVDGRNEFSPSISEKHGIKYVGVGRDS